MENKITLQQFMECISYRITEGGEANYDWFGTKAYDLTFWNGRHDEGGASVSVVFNPDTQEVVQMEAWDYGSSREYRWVNPAYTKAYKKFAKKQGFDPKESLDGRKFIDLDVAADILEKATAIANGQDYDTRVQMEIELPDSDIIELMKIAHQQDVTLNQLIEDILEQFINGRIANED